jgi:YidC/Oxa1 family membrane protein insertase
VVNGPLLWSAFRNKFFVMAMLAAESEAEVTPENLLGGILVGESPLEDRVRVLAAQTVAGGDYGFRLFMGPQEYALLSTLGQSMEEVNPYGWKVFRPIVRPIVSVILKIFVFLHTSLDLGYGWVLVVFGVAMRIVLFPLNHKAMKAQLRNMAVQPLVKEVQEKHKENPEKLQKEMMKLYKEHGFNPLAGCLPMLLPWPVLIALFFVFQNTIELRGVPFLWLPDLSAKDPLYILPVVLALSMFLMQWVSLRSLEQENQQMKMMMYIMPPMMLFIFMNLASGLNLYYATANIATLPQQIWIARERKKMKGQPPPSLSRE